MKKSLVALAALAATSAFAQSSVTMYGIADVSYMSKTHTAGNGTQLSKLTGVSEGANAGNRIGFRGTEDLGGGQKVGFLIEQGINITSGALFSTRAAAGGQQYEGVQGASGNMPAAAYSTNTNRQSYINYSAGFGEIRAGFQYTNLYQLSTLSGYMVGSEQPGSDVAHTFDNATFGGSRSTGLTYIAPQMGAFKLTYQHSGPANAGGRESAEFNVAATNTANGRTVDKAKRDSILVDYNGGPLTASLAYTKFKAQATAGANQQTCTMSAGVPTCAITPTQVFSIFNAATYTSSVAAADYDSTLTQLGARYDLGTVRLSGTYNDGKKTNNLAATGQVKYKSNQIGVEGVFGATRPFFTTGSAKLDTDGANTNDFKQTQFGVRYDLSKRSVAYIMSGNVKDSNATTVASGTTIGKREFTAVGLMHSF